jgi:phospholipid/cholesterol/gamma-HCH transport system permease protein
MRNDAQTVPPEGLAAEDGPSGALVLRLSGNLDAAHVARMWTPALERVRAAKPTALRLDLSGADYIDGAGLALLVRLRAEAETAGAAVDISGLSERYGHLLHLAERSIGAAAGGTGQPEHRGAARRAVEGVDELWRDLRTVVSFVGEGSLALWEAAAHPQSVRWKDVIAQALAVGVESLPILLLIGFLMGLIMSFQSVITLTRFGGEIFVPNMLGLVMFREMGPLVTAILLAARSGSAFAAEIGTMRVNEELDALSTMGISPVRFLVAPRILASLAVTPIMTLIFNFASLVGGALVMLSIGFPLVVFTSRVFANVTASDLVGSMVKIAAFSLLVGGVSCLKGLRTGGGASAVGRSTTSAVVAGLVLITVADGLFAVLFYYYKF